ncbi:hypothetical protein BZG36_02756 [Bifiguratus adelaidae]|uniref:Amidase domain-containing protein n=1 Tax=Bifiguratus adelaidae TaxID=1938954 RepID=A0A261Y1V3_9FUNG|nr:hypothetical protein BZG36_02756 [Bifiguratus adelaidae]
MHFSLTLGRLFAQALIFSSVLSLADSAAIKSDGHGKGSDKGNSNGGHFVPFDPLEATIDSIHAAVYGQTATCRQIVEAYIARIVEYNPQINAILTLNPNALTISDSLDMALANGDSIAKAPLFCVPMFVKDNYDTFDMPTTAGVLALAGAQPPSDAPTIAALRKAGAVIMGKTNLQELALEGLCVSSLGGQTYNPYDLTRTPGGSSGGTGASVAASLACLGTGTDTVNSIRSPASSNSLVGIRATQGLISRSGIVPVSWSQDIAGPLARTVRDAAIGLSVMASVGYDPADNRTAIGEGHRYKDYTKFITGTALKKQPRIGVLDIMFSNATDPEIQAVNTVMNEAIAKIAAAGAEIVHISDPFYNVSALSAAYDVQRFEFRQLMDAYLSAPGEKTPVPDLAALVATGKWFLAPTQKTWFQQVFNYSTWSPGYDVGVAGAYNNVTIHLMDLFASQNLTALIYPEQNRLVVQVGSPGQSGRNGELAGVAGVPVVVIPAGFSSPNTTAPVGVPVGMEILGMPFTEGPLIDLADSIESVLKARKIPSLFNHQVPAKHLDSVPVITPNNTLPYPYHLGPYTN